MNTATEALRGVSSVAKSVTAVGLELISQSTATVRGLQAEKDVGGFTHLLNKAKVILLSSLGQLEVTSRDSVLDTRLRSAAAGTKILERVELEFRNTADLVQKLFEKANDLTTLLIAFRGACDANIVKNEEESEDAVEFSNDPLRNSEEDFVVVSAELEKSDEEFSNSTKKISQLFERFQERLQALAFELHETVNVTCVSINQETRRQLHAEQTDIGTTCSVLKTRLDIQQKAALELRATVDNTKRTIEKLTANPPSSSSEKKTLNDATIQLRTTAELSSRAEHNFLSAKTKYADTVADGKRRLHFSLEQASMSTWSCYNVFFTQFAHFLSDTAKESAQFAKELVNIKNNQNVAKALTKERRERLDQALSTSPPPSPTATPTVAPIADKESRTSANPSGNAQQKLDKLFDGV